MFAKQISRVDSHAARVFHPDKGLESSADGLNRCSVFKRSTSPFPTIEYVCNGRIAEHQTLSALTATPFERTPAHGVVMRGHFIAKEDNVSPVTKEHGCSHSTQGASVRNVCQSTAAGTYEEFLCFADAQQAVVEGLEVRTQMHLLDLFKNSNS